MEYDDRISFLKWFFKWMFRLIFIFSIFASWYIYYKMYIEKPDYRTEMLLFFAVLFVGMLIAFFKHLKDEKSGFIDIYKSSLLIINVFADLIYSAYCIYMLISTGETIDFLVIVGNILLIALVTFLLSFVATLIITCLIILTQALLKAFKMYKEIKEMVTDTGVKTFFKIMWGIISEGYTATKRKAKSGSLLNPKANH